jgi:23S rRNA pseudouridine1911/1915/1917 synthase
MEISVIFEDTYLLIINKPPGIVVNRALTVKEETIQDWVEEHVHHSWSTSNRQENKDFTDRAGIVHRIDKETSGILCIAKTPDTFMCLQHQFKNRTVAKTYLALVHGYLKPMEGEIRAPVGRLPWNKERFGITPGGKDAVTKYNCISLLHRTIGSKHEQLSLVEVHPLTGRTHQIRVHFKYLNHPVIGDYLYAGRKTARADRKWAARVLLHAWRLRFRHPVTDQNISLEAPVPSDMMEIIQTSDKV